MRHQPRMSMSCVFGVTILIAALFVGGCTHSSAQAVVAQVQVTSTSGNLPEAAESGAYPATTLSATGGVGLFTWSVTQGALPTGMSLSTTGVVSGTPTQSGVFSFTVTATDEQGHSATAALSVTINPPIA